MKFRKKNQSKLQKKTRPRCHCGLLFVLLLVAGFIEAHWWLRNMQIPAGSYMYPELEREHGNGEREREPRERDLRTANRNI